jgi:2-dehydro-3-deoxyphosphooctonate aldolase (KDO 8-P synthase)
MKNANNIIRLVLPTGGECRIGNTERLTIIAGPCAMESRDHALMIAEKLKKLSDNLDVNIIYKSSFDKANRTSIASDRGIGLDKALPIFDEIRKTYNMACLTDVHSPDQASRVSEVIDILQIPAFLCRQTDLLIAAAKTGKIINIKKGQFLAPNDMSNVVQKVVESDNPNVLLCERGTSFGYNTLITDFRGLTTMKRYGPVIFDATHSVQQPGGLGKTSSGQKKFVPTLARAAVSIGVAGVFIETHQDPKSAPSDGPNMVPLSKFDNLIDDLLKFDSLAKINPITEL